MKKDGNVEQLMGTIQRVADGDSIRVDEINASRLSILCLPARSQADEIAAMMLAQVLETSGYRAQAIAVTALAGEMVDLVDQQIEAPVIVPVLLKNSIHWFMARR